MGTGDFGRGALPPLRTERRRTGNDRGVALIVVLLSTALLMALIFEFAYATRVSLRAAVNYRDSQRANYLARSGVNFVGSLLVYNLKRDPATGKDRKFENLEQREWQVVPFMPGTDTELRVRWEDESGKINIANLTRNTDAYRRLINLFTYREVNQAILDRIDIWMLQEQRKFHLLTELRQFMSDEEYRKVGDALTVLPGSVPTQNKININTASADVIRSIGLDPQSTERFVEQRNQQPFEKEIDVGQFLGTENATKLGGQWVLTSDVFKVNSFATVGRYTKQIEALITRKADGFKVVYWRVL